MSSELAYIGTFVIIFVWAIFYELLVTLRMKFESKYKPSSKSSSSKSHHHHINDEDDAHHDHDHHQNGHKSYHISDDLFINGDNPSARHR